MLGGVLAARILIAVGSDDEDGFFRAIFVTGIFVHIANVVDGAAKLQMLTLSVSVLYIYS